MGIKRAWKHSKRFVSKNVFRNKAHKDNLKELEKILVKFDPYRPDERVAICPSQVPTSTKIKYAFGQFDFSWLKELSDDDFYDFNGAWIATLQAYVSESADPSLASQPFHLVRKTFFRDGETDKEAKKAQAARWIDLQTIKDHYKDIAVGGKGKFARFKRWCSKKSESMDDKIHRNRFFGPYLTRFHDFQNALDAIEGSDDGPQNQREVKQMLGFGIYKFIKGALKTTKKVVTGKWIGAVKDGVRALDSLGGLIAGVSDLCLHKQADFRKLSSRLGVSQKIAKKKHELLVGHEDGTLLDQVKKGPSSLLRSDKFDYEKQVEKLHKSTRHAVYWCTIWKHDVEEIEKDLEGLERRPWNEEFKLILEQVESGGFVKPSEVKKLKSKEIISQIKKRVTEEKKALAKLKKKIEDWDKDMRRRLKELDELTAGQYTRKSIASTQRKLGSTGVAFDAPRALALEIAQFDKTKLKKPKEMSFQKKKKKTLEDIIKENMEKRRRAMRLDDD